MADTLTESRVGGGRVLLLSGSFSGMGRSSVFTPRVVLPQTAGVINPVWICVRGTAGSFGSAQLEYSPDGGTNWHPIVVNGSQLFLFTATGAVPFEPNIPGCQLSINCTSYSSTLYYDVRQAY